MWLSPGACLAPRQCRAPRRSRRSTSSATGAAKFLRPAGRPRRNQARSARSYNEAVETLAKILIGVAAAIALVGAGLLVAAKLGWSGRLPGDIVVRKGNWTFYAPLGLSIAISLLLTILLNVFLRR
jgi:hypothetical protein